MTEKKTIEISVELWEVLQQIKGVFKQISGEDITDDEQVIGILAGSFIQSLNNVEHLYTDMDNHGCCGGSCGCGHNHKSNIILD